MFGWEFPPHISGGLGTACYGITSGLLRQKVGVIFVVPRLYGDEDHPGFRLLSASDVTVNLSTPHARKWADRLTYIQVRSAMLPYMSPQEYAAVTNESRNEVRQKKGILGFRFNLTGTYGRDLMQEVWHYALVSSEIARRHPHDIIHAHDWLTYPAGIAAKEAGGRTLIVHMHATEFDRSGDNINRDVYEIERKGMQAADHVIAVSEFTKQIIVSRYGIDSRKVTVVHNAVVPRKGEDIAARKIGEKIVTFMGRITFQKGPDYFIESAAKVLKFFPEARFVMAGSGDMTTRMINRVAELRISSRFHFTGFLKREEVSRMFAMSDVYVMPSVSEPFGIAPLEALQSNVPVIISRQSGVSEVLKHAIKVDFWDTDALANSICALLKYQTLSRTFAEKGREEVEKMKWDHTAIKIRNAYEKTCRTYVN